ncbi:MAG: recombinase family protein [Candidatus Peribacteraceae bacterium]|nr:recombinase family protein [Candidatus Peribacteraceae bacterium]
MKRVFAYLRVSTAHQLDGYGFDRQKEACQKLAELKGWSIVRAFEEQESGSVDSMDRPKLTEALNLCGEQYDTILVERVDRIARDLVVAELFFRECKKRGVKIYSADTGEELVDAQGDPTRKLIRQILGALAEWDKSQTCKKLQAGRRRKKHETGKPCGGSYPFGDHPNPVVRRPQQLALWHILNSVREGKSLSWIADSLFRRRMLNPHGGERWSRSSVHAVARKNEFRTHFDLLNSTEHSTLLPEKEPSHMTPEELTEYNRINQARSRERRKESSNEQPKTDNDSD